VGGEAVLKPDVYDPAIDPLYNNALSHYGSVALACRVRDPDRKGKAESGVGHAEKSRSTALQAATAAYSTVTGLISNGPIFERLDRFEPRGSPQNRP
jgi:transposase